MRWRELRWGLLLGGVVVSFGLAQKMEKTPQLMIFMRGVPTPEKAEVGYSVNAGQFYSYMLPTRFKKSEECTIDRDGVQHCGRQQPGRLQDFVIEASVNRVMADRVRAVVLIPGCQSQLVDVAMQGKREVNVDAKCVRSPLWKFKGRIVDDSLKDRKRLKIQVTYKANWAPGFLGAEKAGVDQVPPEPPQFDVVSVPVSKDGSFSIDLPILAHDPAEEGAEPEERGELVFTLLDVRSESPVVLGTLLPDKFATEAGGVELRMDYPELEFVVKREQ
jgi:hypothetical protein